VGVVTFSRQYGAGGRRVAAAVAQAIDYTLVDPEVVEQAAAQAGLDREVAENLDERVPALIEKVGLALAAASPEFGLIAPPADDDRILAEGIRNVMRSLSVAGGYVILGRGGQAALHDRPDACHVQLVGDLEDRARSIVEWQGISIERARERCRQVDADRAAYVKRFYGIDITEPLLYDAVLNTSRLGIEGASVAATAVARRRLGLAHREPSHPPITPA
jgi:cytidylate kinase